jgi:hypothetical protein
MGMSELCEGYCLESRSNFIALAVANLTTMSALGLATARGIVASRLLHSQTAEASVVWRIAIRVFGAVCKFSN